MTRADGNAGNSTNRAAPANHSSDSVQSPLTEEEIRVATLGEPTTLGGPVQIVDYDPQWPELFDRASRRIQAALGDRLFSIEHVGSTSVPGLAAKPTIDIMLAVANSADESAYVPALEAAGFVLRIREPDWHEHRMFKGSAPDLNIHVFSVGCPEIERMLLFRNWLRTHASDRQLYECTKRDLAARDWKYMQNYADAKSEVVRDILSRANVP